MEYNSERRFLKELFAYFGCEDADIKEVENHDDELPIMFFIAGDAVEGRSIDSPEWYPFFGADTPHFLILGQRMGVTTISICMELELVKDFLVERYLLKGYDTLAVYFNKGAVVNPQPVEFGAVLHFCDSYETLNVENFGSVEYGEITKRAVLSHESNMSFPMDLTEVEHIYLNNAIELRMVSDDHETYADNFRFAFSVEDLEYYVAVLKEAAKKGNYVFKFLVNKKEVFDLDAVEEELAQSKTFWRGVYDEGYQK